MTYSTNLTSKGQVTVPVSIRRRLGLKPGEPVRFRVTTNNQVVIEKNNWKEELNDLHQQVASQLAKQNITPKSVKELDQLIDQSAQQAVTEEWEKDKGTAR